MKTLAISLTICLAFNSAAVAQQQARAIDVATARPAATPAPVISIPARTIIDLELDTDVRTDSYKEGDLIGLRVAQDVVAGGKVVVERGALARAKVYELNRARRWGKGGEIAWVLQDVTAVNGQRIPLEFSYSFKGVKNHSEVITGGVVTSVIYGLPTLGILAPVGLLFGLRKGKEVILPKGKLFEAVVRTDTLLSARVMDTPTAGYTPTMANAYRERNWQEFSTSSAELGTRVRELLSVKPQRICSQGGYRVPCPEDQ
jgi:hypothetical protein